MPRIPPITERRGLSATQLEVFDKIAANRGGVRGPFTMLLHRPELAAHAQEIGAYLRFRSPLPDAVRESTILVVATRRHCAVEWATHSKLALKAGVDPSVVEDIRVSRTAGHSGEVGVAIDLARELLDEDRVSPELFERARALWGNDGVLDLVAVVAYYSFLAAILNAFEVEPH